jgi:hypothetical protein
MTDMRKSWTDERLDDFVIHVDQRFDVVDRRFDTLERRMDNGFIRVDARIDALQRTMLQLGVAVIVALIGLIATQI